MKMNRERSLWLQNVEVVVVVRKNNFSLLTTTRADNFSRQSTDIFLVSMFPLYLLIL